MSHPLIVLKAPLDLDLSPLTQHLWSERISHRVVIEGNMQCLLVADQRHVHTVADIVTQWREGTLAPPDRESYSVKLTLAFNKLIQAPVTTAIIIVVVMAFVWMQLSKDWVGWIQAGQSLWPDGRAQLATYLDMGLWSLWRPTLLHFSALHLINNVFWIWILGRAIELIDSRWYLLTILIGSGLLGNALQWWYAGPAFGGISGVVFGLLGWVGWRQLTQQVNYKIPRSLLGIMLALLVISLTADSLLPGLTGMAHGGHIGGLIFGLLFAMVNKKRR